MDQPDNSEQFQMNIGKDENGSYTVEKRVDLPTGIVTETKTYLEHNHEFVTNQHPEGDLKRMIERFTAEAGEEKMGHYAVQDSHAGFTRAIEMEASNKGTIQEISAVFTASGADIPAFIVFYNERGALIEVQYLEDPSSAIRNRIFIKPSEDGTRMIYEMFIETPNIASQIDPHVPNATGEVQQGVPFEIEENTFTMNVEGNGVILDSKLNKKTLNRDLRLKFPIALDAQALYDTISIPEVTGWERTFDEARVTCEEIPLV